MEGPSTKFKDKTWIIWGMMSSEFADEKRLDPQLIVLPLDVKKKNENKSLAFYFQNIASFIKILTLLL